MSGESLVAVLSARYAIPEDGVRRVLDLAEIYDVPLDQMVQFIEAVGVAMEDFEEAIRSVTAILNADTSDFAHLRARIEALGR